MTKEKGLALFLALWGFLGFYQSCFAYEYVIKDLVDLTNRCFKECPEYCASKCGIYDDTIFKDKETCKDMTAALDEFALIMKGQLGNENSWKGNKSAFLKDDTLFSLSQNLLFFDNQNNQKYFVMKLDLNKGEICITGDLHGAIHSLLRNLWRLVLLGKLGIDFKVKDPKICMVFLGDNADRGWYGFEVWYTLLRLKNANPDNVFLMRGNHECKIIAEKKGDGFLASSRELLKKFTGKEDSFKQKMLNMFELLPKALFVFEDSKIIQFMHDGSQAIWDKFDSIKNAKKPFILLNMICEESYIYRGNVNFIEPETITWEGYSQFDMPNYISLFFRGHNHNYFGLKLFPKKDADYPKILSASQKKYDTCKQGYNDGLHWKDIMQWFQAENKETTEPSSEINLDNENIYHIYTLSSSSADVLQVPYDCFGILNVAKNKLKVYEVPLGQNEERTGKFASLELSNDANEAYIKAVFKAKKPEEKDTVIDENILKKVKEYEKKIEEKKISVAAPNSLEAALQLLKVKLLSLAQSLSGKKIGKKSLFE